ncbi:MAG: hypothetical protein H7122_05950 [Chitinophagaceae bacterium]|nr:hypothetical protein [Chitinophagaceae bacterium]
MKTSFIQHVFSVCLLFTLPFFGCQKTQTIPTTEEQEEFVMVSSESDAEAESIFNDVLDNVLGVNSDVGIGETGIFSASALDSFRCHSITTTHLSMGLVFPIRILLDFGSGCTGQDGRTRKGKIIIEYSNRITLPGATVTVRFDSYLVNNIRVEGTHSISNKSTAAGFLLEIKIAATLYASNGNFSQWKAARNITQVEGQLTPRALDDVFTISGSASGSARKSNRFYQWATIISRPLIKKFSCRWIIQGGLTIMKGTARIAEVDYGSGQCDNKAGFTVLGHVREITLH